MQLVRLRGVDDRRERWRKRERLCHAQRLRFAISVRIGEVPVMAKPDRISPSNIVSQRVEAVTLNSLCLFSSPSSS